MTEAGENNLPDVSTLSFEQALEELERLTAQMASGNVTLEESVRSYERGAKLLQRCRSELTRAREAIERIRAETGAPTVADSYADGDPF
ncbi:exodeoxyribonuclease VII small subunit [Sutterella sp.]|uniref:exodeoxyribonuclease VII small subunit n=1 Tax=Sutterella sp. TaxID=1981025 RepID=UPI0026E0F0C7|nr:exodeoxyribonuclease VII small subunit [Sutterella sp.]MDO5531382.1 exodeoxyribonuclease VII small subunit [Sutterella sp.]